MENNRKLHTRQTLANDLLSLGAAPDMTVIAHTSLRAIGRVVGGAVSVILALEDTIGENGNLVMPTQTEQLCEPDEYDGNLSAEEIEIIKNGMPLYDPDLTPTAYMGFIAETFRKQKGVRRSEHPHMSFAAWGADAERIAETHPLHYALSETSPLGRLYERDARILLLGAPTDSNTSLHLAEYKQTNTFVKPKIWGVKMSIEGEERWTTYTDINNNSDDFGRIFDDFRADTDLVRAGRIGDAPSFLIPQREMVDYALDWMNRNRSDKKEPCTHESFKTSF